MDDWLTSNLPHGQTDLEKLVRWFHERDMDCMSDALWLRYVKIGKRAYQPNNSDRARKFHEAHLDQFPFARKPLQSPPPFSIRILPGNASIG
jgi:hypothetical protein